MKRNIYKGLIFYSRFLVNLGNRTDVELGKLIPITVVRIDKEKNELEVDWGSGAGNEVWDLNHCLWAFERGDYVK